MKRQQDSHLKDDDDEQEDIPSYMKSFRKNGVLVKRPSRPRSDASIITLLFVQLAWCKELILYPTNTTITVVQSQKALSAYFSRQYC